MSLTKIATHRGPKVLMGCAIVITVLLIGTMIIQNQNYDNDKVEGTYSGVINFDDSLGILIQFSFNGKGNFNGTMKNASTTYTIEKGFYQCVGFDLGITYYANDTMIMLIGTFNEAYSSIETGDAQYRTLESAIVNGTFSLTLI